jgi:acyl-CoA synthetase (AMP-forming)/AMP-acid ligase II/acyl carrier protein
MTPVRVERAGDLERRGLPDTISGRLLLTERRLDDRPFLQLVQDNTAVRDHSYGDCLNRARQWAATYQALGVEPGARVVIILQHSLDLYSAFFGAILHGAIPAMFAFPSPKFDEAEYFRTFGSLIENADPTLVVVYPELRDQVARELAAREPAVAVCTQRDVVERTTTHVHLAEADDVAFLQYSSGTTGAKKGVAITHRGALAQLDRYASAITLNESDRIASWLPLYHDMGLVACCLLPFVTGTPVLAMAPHRWVRSPILLLHMIGVHSATLCWLPNFAFNFLAKNIMPRELNWLDLSSLRAVINCSEPLMASSHRVFVEKFAGRGFRPTALAACYAMAETTFAIAATEAGRPIAEDVVDREALTNGRAQPALPSDGHSVRLVSSGRAIDDTAIEIRAESGGAALPDRTIGEIVVRSASLFSGYFGRADLTSEVLHDGWFHTGDLGYTVDGELFVTGRRKDLLIVAGRNLSPHDIEAAVDDVTGVIAGRSVAFGLADEHDGTERMIVIAETTLTDAAQREELQRQILSRVAAQAGVAPSDVRLVPPRWLKKSTSGKIARDRNRQQYLEQLRTLNTPESVAAANGARFEETTLDRAVGCVRRVLAKAGRPGANGIGPDDRLVTTGLIDSLLLVTLIVEAEGTFAVTIPPTHLDIGHFDTARRLAALVSDLGMQAPESLQNANEVWAMDDRDKACAGFLEHAEEIDLLMLGSSKAMHLSSAVAREFGYTAFNFWLQNARAEDWLAALRFALDHGGPLRAVVLMMDVEGLSNAAAVDPRLMESVHLRRYVQSESDAAAGTADSHSEAGADRFNTIFTQFKLGQHEPWAWALSGVNYRVTERFTSAGEPSGDRSRRALADPHDSDAQYALRMRDFTALDPDRLEDLRALLARCATLGIHVHCCISPVHETLDAFLAGNTSYMNRLDDLVTRMRALAHPGFTFHDTRTAAAFGGFADDFNDAAHIAYANSDRLLRFVLSRTTRRAVDVHPQAASRQADYVSRIPA